MHGEWFYCLVCRERSDVYHENRRAKSVRVDDYSGKYICSSCEWHLNTKRGGWYYFCKHCSVVGCSEKSCLITSRNGSLYVYSYVCKECEAGLDK